MLLRLPLLLLAAGLALAATGPARADEAAERARAEAAKRAAEVAARRAALVQAMAAKEQAVATLQGGYGPASGGAPTGDSGGALTDEQTLRSAGLGADGPALLGFFRARTQTQADPAKVAALVGKLTSKTAEEREKASGGLVALGPLAVPALRQATRDPDEPEVAAAARRCLQFIEGTQAAVLPAAAARLLAQKKPQGAADALLDYLPYADDENLLEEVKGSLAALAQDGGKPDSALLRGLDDKSPLRRAVVAEVLCRAGNEEVLPALRKLLKDPKPVVRLRVALALANTKDADAVGTLVELLADLPAPLARQAEEYLVNLAADQAPGVPLGTDDASRKRARDAWAKWWRSTEGAAPLQEFKKRTLTEADRLRAQGLIKQLDDDTFDVRERAQIAHSFDVRERAQIALQEMGSGIAPLLRQAITGGEEEVKKRAQKCLDAIEKDRTSPLLPVQARLIALRKPAGAAEVLLAFLPFADEDTVFDEVRAALAAVAVRGGKADPALVKALEDRLPLRRAVAAEALALGGAADQRPAVRKLLQDPDASVRLRVALALGASHEREAVPVLIDLLAELPTEKGIQAEMFLRGLVGERAPNVYLGPDDASRKRVREAWAGWWKTNGATVDMSRTNNAPRMLGYTLIVSTDFNRVFEVGLDGKVRWQLDNLQYPRDAVVLPGERILVAEQGIQRVSEWNAKKEMVWQKQVSGPPVGVQRMPNGNTLVVMVNGMVEMDRAGKDVFTYNRPNFDIMSGYRAPDGQAVIVTNNGMVVRLDASGKEVKTFHLGGQAPWSVQLLPNGRVLVPLPNNNKVVEYDGDGKVVWEAAVQFPFSAQRLPNGNTLVASYNMMKVVELNRGGRVVWEYKCNGNDRPYRAHRR
jgi:HEAT repeat protein